MFNNVCPKIKVIRLANIRKRYKVGQEESENVSQNKANCLENIREDPKHAMLTTAGKYPQAVPTEICSSPASQLILSPKKELSKSKACYLDIIRENKASRLTSPSIASCPSCLNTCPKIKPVYFGQHQKILASIASQPYILNVLK